MNQTDRLERDLTAWFVDTAMPRLPDYVDDILGATEQIRQRPRWTFVTRWLPKGVADRTWPIGTRVPWRTIALLAMLALLAAAAAFYVGSRTRVPPPFGLAENGLFAYSRDGDVYVLDRTSGLERPLVTGSDTDSDPRWSLDGTRVAFLRDVDASRHLVIVDARGWPIARSESLLDPDPDSIAWSPDGRSIALGAWSGSRRKVVLIDARTGATRKLDSSYKGYEVYWRPPPNGHDLLLTNESGELTIVDTRESNARSARGLGLVAVGQMRPMGWTPDGRGFLYQLDQGEHPVSHVFDMESGFDTPLDLAYGHLSNDGLRVAGLHNGLEFFCVAPLTGEPCKGLRLPRGMTIAYDYGASIQWTPDDRWLVLTDINTGQPWLVDPSGLADAVPLTGDGAGAFQRVAP